MLSFDIENFSVLTTIAAPPPRLVPGRGVLIYLSPLISKSSSILNWWRLFSDFSQISVKNEIVVFQSSLD